MADLQLAADQCLNGVLMHRGTSWLRRERGDTEGRHRTNRESLLRCYTVKLPRTLTTSNGIESRNKTPLRPEHTHTRSRTNTHTHGP